jgi:hypothetical protein
MTQRLADGNRIVNKSTANMYRDSEGRTRRETPESITISDPVAQGIVGNLAHPRGNITGFTTLSLDLSSKRLELLKEILPGVRRVGVLWSQTNSALPFAATQAAALLSSRARHKIRNQLKVPLIALQPVEPKLSW